MTTMRTPISHAGKFKITDEAVRIFKCMYDDELPDCTCNVMASNADCPGCEQYSQLHRELRELLKLPPSHPGVIRPDVPCCYPRGTGGYEWWGEAQRLWAALDKLAFPDEQER
jgi:hypothetical protein